MTSRPSLGESLESGELHNLRENPEKLSSKKRLLYEIENLLNMPEKGLQLESLNGSIGRTVVSNRELYKIYKALLSELEVQPTLVYTGNTILPAEKARVIAEEKGKNIQDLELSL